MVAARHRSSKVARAIGVSPSGFPRTGITSTTIRKVSSAPINRNIDRLSKLRLIGAEETFRIVVEVMPVRGNPDGETPIARATFEERCLAATIVNYQFDERRTDGRESRKRCGERCLIATIKKVPFATTE